MVQENWVIDHLDKLDIYKCMGPDRGNVARSLLVIIKRSQQSEEVPEDWKKANVSPVFNKGKK